MNSLILLLIIGFVINKVMKAAQKQPQRTDQSGTTDAEAPRQPQKPMVRTLKPATPTVAKRTPPLSDRLTQMKVTEHRTLETYESTEGMSMPSSLIPGSEEGYICFDHTTESSVSGSDAENPYDLPRAGEGFTLLFEPEHLLTGVIYSEILSRKPRRA